VRPVVVLTPLRRSGLAHGTLSCLFVLLAGCGSVRPVPYSDAEVSARVQLDLVSMYADQEPIEGPLSFEQAAARALKYNLDYRLKLMETALAQSLQNTASLELLPNLVAGAGYAGRNNDSGGRSIGIEDRIESLRPSTAQERERVLGNLAFSWNVLDFGVSYYRAQQRADQVLMAEERRRKVVQNLLQDVRNSYWRAVGAQQLIDRVDALLERVRSALARAQQVEAEGLMPQAEVLAYQRALLDAVNLLTLRRQDLELARAELGALMSLAPGTAYILSDVDIETLPAVPANIEALERLALEKRPELLEEWYRKRVTENDIKAAKVLLWPNLSVDLAGQSDSNVYNYNERWVDAGVRLSWNLLKLAQLPALQTAQEFQNRTDDTRRLALSMAILTQVRVAVQRYGLSLAELEFAEQSLRVDQRLLAVTQAGASSSVASELELIRTEARGLLAEYQRYASYSNAQAGWGRLYNSLGLDVLPATIDSHDLATLAAEIAQTLTATETAGLLAVPRRDANRSTLPPAGTVVSNELPETPAVSTTVADLAAESVKQPGPSTAQEQALEPLPAPEPEREPESQPPSRLPAAAATSVLPAVAANPATAAAICTASTDPVGGLQPLAQRGRSPAPLVASDQLSSLDPSALETALADLRQALASAQDDYRARPRRQVIAPNVPTAGPGRNYADAWRTHIRRQAGQEFVQVAESCSRAVVLRLLVALKPDGNPETVSILASSGLREVDQAAIDTIRREAPFAAFPASLLADADVLEIIDTWRFTPGQGIVQ